MNTTNQIKPLTDAEKIRLLEEVIKFGSEHSYNDLVRKSRRSLELLRQNSRVGERA
jgi:hypothetical protein